VPDDHPPSEPGGDPRLEVSWRAAWIAGGLVLALVAVFVAVVWGFGSPDGTPSGGPGRSSPPTVTAPSSTTPTELPPRKGHHRHRHLRDPLQPVRFHQDPSCPIGRIHLVRVLQFNIHAGLSRYGGLGIAQIAAEIRAARPDLVSLNEVDSGTTRSDRIDEPAYLARATGLHAVYGPNLLRYDGGRFGNAVLSRFPIVDHRNIRLPRQGHSEPRGLLRTTVRIGRRDVSFYSVHLSQGHLRGAAQRARQADAVAQIIRSNGRPTIVSGDLNSRPGDLPERILRQYLIDAQQQAGTGSGDTVPEGDPLHRIDYVLYDNDFAAVPGETQVLPSASSDHRMLLTELVLRPRHQC
jgi:endonuclease/exonuclease/phosphatase family metal-dependent hydrolase